MDDEISPEDLFGVGIDAAPSNKTSDPANEIPKDSLIDDIEKNFDDDVDEKPSAPAQEATAVEAKPVQPLFSVDDMAAAARLKVPVDQLLAWKPEEVQSRLATAAQYIEFQRQIAAQEETERNRAKQQEAEQQQQFDHAAAVEFYKKKEFDPEMAIHLAQKDQAIYELNRIRQELAQDRQRQQQQNAAQAVASWQSQIRDGIAKCPPAIQEVAKDPVKMQAILVETQKMGVQLHQLGQQVPNEVELAKRAAYALYGDEIVHLAQNRGFSEAFRSGATSRTRPSTAPAATGEEAAVRAIANSNLFRKISGGFN